LRDKPSYHGNSLDIEPVTPEDLPVFMELVGELATFLKAPRDFTNTQEGFQHALFDDPPLMEAIMLRYDGEVAGMATWFENYEVLQGRKVMWFDYFYVRPEFRRRPIAPGVLIYLLILAREREYLWLEGTVNEWNNEAMSLYKMLKAEEPRQKLFRFTLEKLDWSLMRPFLPSA